MHRRSRAGTGASLVALSLVVGCSATPVESRLDEYGDRAQAIHTAMLDRVPATAEVSTTSEPRFDDSGVLSPNSHDTAFWETDSVIEVAGDTTSTAVADAVGESLVDQGWAAEETVEPGGTWPLSTVYRLPDGDDEWTVQVHSQPLDGRGLVLTLQSPVTVRGSG